jgi:hypothetical protein
MYLVIAVCLPLIFSIMGVLAGIVSRVYHTINRNHTLSQGFFRMQITKTIVVLIGLGYSSIVVGVLQMVGCTSEDNLSKKHYLNVYLGQ